MKVKIVPSILTTNFRAFTARLRAVAPAGEAQLDVLDGSFVPYRNFFDPKKIDQLSPNIPLEVHLMVNDLAREIPRWNYPWVKKIIFHLETSADPGKDIALIKKIKKKAGIALNPDTPAAAASPYLKKVDTVLVMSVFPGQGGQKFIPSVLGKIRALRSLSGRLNIEVDGGINPQSARKCVLSGANLLVAGNYLDNKNFAQKFDSLKKILS